MKYECRLQEANIESHMRAVMFGDIIQGLFGLGFHLHSLKERMTQQVLKKIKTI